MLQRMHHIVSGAARRLAGETLLATPSAILPPARFVPPRWPVRNTPEGPPKLDENRVMARPAAAAADRAAEPGRGNSRARETLRGPGAISRGSNNRAPAAAG